MPYQFPYNEDPVQSSEYRKQQETKNSHWKRNWFEFWNASMNSKISIDKIQKHFHKRLLMNNSTFFSLTGFLLLTNVFLTNQKKYESFSLHFFNLWISPKYIYSHKITRCTTVVEHKIASNEYFTYLIC